MTYADKYALMKSYKIITGDDPDQNASEEDYKKTKTKTTNKVTDVEAKSIYALMIRKGINVVQNLQKNYGISNTSDLTKEQYITILHKIKDLPDKESFDSNDKHKFDGEP